MDAHYHIIYPMYLYVVLDVPLSPPPCIFPSNVIPPCPFCESSCSIINSQRIRPKNRVPTVASMIICHAAPNNSIPHPPHTFHPAPRSATCPPPWASPAERGPPVRQASKPWVGATCKSYQIILAGCVWSGRGKLLGTLSPTMSELREGS
ncbi:hypothetical protein M430DRAFT_68855 [Amorphotheca resinae ATCC 22711]|uniref:Uncharacterized protein n=1 Tax=Amorphotheca resinae ATCC 22711 TaxID=857342 RepID=A0A2T3AVJ5_AMORE|nr:hypothetical protein M430DRAFT_68855 [Amorphotheca resinae ATCC 22711]PSS12653.1 hypothetical protein M430DRAFT_68855 [Amorphotheca resinae ATCC 22711]